MIDLPAITVGTDGPEAHSATPLLLRGLLADLDSELKRVGIPVDAWLEVPVVEADMRSAFDEAGLVLPDELLELYRWHNGARQGGHAAIPRFAFESFELALRNYHVWNSVDDGEDTSEFANWGAPLGWLKLFSDNYTLAVECRESPDRPPRFRMTEPDFAGQSPRAQGRSLATMIAWVLEGIRSGAHTWDAIAGAWRLEEQRLPEMQRRYRLV